MLSPFVWVSWRVLKMLRGDFHVFPLLQVRTWWSPNPLHSPAQSLLFQMSATTQAYSWRCTKVFLQAGANLSPLLPFPKPLPVPLGCYHIRSRSVLNRRAKAPCASCHRCLSPMLRRCYGNPSLCSHAAVDAAHQRWGALAAAGC